MASKAQLPNTNQGLRSDYFDRKYKEFKEGCDAGSPHACFALGEWYQLLGKDLAKAKQVYETNCAIREDPNSCFNLANLVLHHQELELGQEAKAKFGHGRDAAARTMLSLACSSGQHSQACSVLATLVLSGRGGEQDTARGMALLESLCEAPVNDARSCVRIGGALLRPSFGLKRDPARAFRFVQRGCDELGHPNACQILSVMYAKGDGVTQDSAKALHYRTKTAELVNATGEKLGTDVVAPPQ